MNRDGKERLTLVLADNGVLVDWPDNRSIYYNNQEGMVKLVSDLAAFVQGFYSEAFETHTIEINTRVHERFDGPEGIRNTSRYP